MTYEAFRISYQSSELAARSAYQRAEELMAHRNQLLAQRNELLVALCDLASTVGLAINGAPGWDAHRNARALIDRMKGQQ